MNKPPSSIGRRLADCIVAYRNQEYESALVHFFPALDKVAKLRRPNVRGVGSRIRAFLTDEVALISLIATGSVIRVTCNGVTFADAIYEFGRCPIAHEGELDPRLKITTSGIVRVGQVWELPHSYIFGLWISVIVAPECVGEKIALDGQITLYERTWEVNDLWGAKLELQRHILSVVPMPRLFD